jgi:hypothetical protein
MNALCLRNFKTLLSVLFVALSLQSLGQGPSGFSNLSRHLNHAVTVETPDGKVTGQLLRVEEGRLVVYRDGSPQPIAQDKVMRVIRHPSRHTAAWIGGGAAAGFGFGLLIGFRAFDDSINGSSKIAALAAAEAGVGAAIGFGLSRIGKDQVVYESVAQVAVRQSSGEVDRDEHSSYVTQTGYLYRSVNLPYVSRARAATHGTAEEHSERTLPEADEVDGQLREHKVDEK